MKGYREVSDRSLLLYLPANGAADPCLLVGLTLCLPADGAADPRRLSADGGVDESLNRTLVDHRLIEVVVAALHQVER